MIDIQKTEKQLQDHLKELTVTIGERSVRFAGNLEKAENYIKSFYRDIGLEVQTEPYRYRDFTVSNVIAQVNFRANPSKRYLLGHIMTRCGAQ